MSEPIPHDLGAALVADAVCTYCTSPIAVCGFAYPGVSGLILICTYCLAKVIDTALGWKIRNVIAVGLQNRVAGSFVRQGAMVQADPILVGTPVRVKRKYVRRTVS